MKNQFKVSILICVQNAAKYIETNLYHISQQKNIAFDDLEIILIDNNSADNTDQIALAYWQNLNNPFLLRLEYEAKQGKPYALKKAFQLSNNNLFSANILLFVRDFVSQNLTNDIQITLNIEFSNFLTCQLSFYPNHNLASNPSPHVL